MEQESEFAEIAITEQQQVGWPRVAAVSSMVALSLPTFITGLEIFHALSPRDAFWALFWGSVILFLIGSLMAAIGARTHMSSYLLVRIAFGDKGAGIVNIAFAVSLLGWFGININLFAEASSRLISSLFGLSISHILLSILASFVMTVTTLRGFAAINRLSVLMVPVLALVTVLLVVHAIRLDAFATMAAQPNEPVMSLGDGISIVVGAIIVGVIILPDITRFVRHWSGGVATAFVSMMIVQLIVMGAAALAGGATRESDILDIMLDLGLGFGAFIIVIASSWVLNALNLYSLVLSVKSTFPARDEKIMTIVFGLVGIAAALLNILDYFVVFLFYLSIIFVPVAGVIIIDYFFVQSSAYQIDTLKKNRALAPKAFVSSALGVVAAITMSENIISSVTGMAALDAMALSAFAYLALSFSDRKKTNAVSE